MEWLKHYHIMIINLVLALQNFLKVDKADQLLKTWSSHWGLGHVNEQPHEYVVKLMQAWAKSL